MSKTLELTKSEFAENFLYHKGEPFSLDDYPFMRPVYNSPAKDIVLKFSRQCVEDNQEIRLADGRLVRAKDIKPGDPIMGFDTDSLKNKRVYVKDVWDNGTKPCYRVTTRMGHKCVVTENHPFWKIDGWHKANELKEGDLIAVSQDNSCTLPDKVTVKRLDFSDEIFDLSDKDSPDKRDVDHPEFIHTFTEYQIKSYIRMWWSVTDRVYPNNRLGIRFYSKKMAYGIRELLLKIGIPCKIYYVNEAYKVSVINRWVQDKFLAIIDDKASNLVSYKKNNDQTFTYDADYIYDIIEKSDYSKKDKLKRHKVVNKSTLIHLEVITKIPALQKLVDADHYYDVVTGVENIGEKSSTAIEINDTGNFYIDNIATKNTGKSSTLANLIVSNCAMIDNFSSLYLSPTVDQTKIFSNDRVKPVIQQSPFIQKYYYDEDKTVQNMFNKEFLNGSRMFFKYALLNADRIRGISADAIFADEAQDLLTDILPVVYETMSRSPYKWTIISGTPKRTKGTLASAWYGSTMNEYMLKCEGCNKWNLLNEDNIGKHGLICSKCGSELSMWQNKGQWVSTYAKVEDRPIVEGYRICALHFYGAPWVDWKKDIIYKMENTSKGLFYNETLALEYDAGSIPITKTEIIRACNEDYKMAEDPDKSCKGRKSILALDYGPVSSESSYTVASIIQPRGDYLQVVYAKKFVGKEAEYSFIHEEIPKLMEKWNAVILASDYGMGESSNSVFRDILGEDKVISFQHLPTQKDRIKWQERMGAYTINRNEAFDNFFAMLKNGKLKLPSYETFEDFTDDIRNIQLDYDEKKNKVKYINMGPDDFVHATIFGMISAEIVFKIANI